MACLLPGVHPGMAAHCPLNWSSSYSVKRKISGGREYQSGNNYSIRGQGLDAKKVLYTLLYPQNSLMQFLLAHDHHCEVNWKSRPGQSIDYWLEFHPPSFCIMDQSASYFLLSFQRHRLQGTPNYVNRSWIRLFFQAPPVTPPGALSKSVNTSTSRFLTDKRTKYYLLSRVWTTNWTTWGLSQAPSWWKERTNPHKLPSVLHTGTVVHAHSHTNVFKRGKGRCGKNKLILGAWFKRDH